jgi:GT2 family glycosyltransferase
MQWRRPKVLAIASAAPVISLPDPAAPRASVMIAAGAGGPLLDRCLERLAEVGGGAVAFETIVFLDGAGDDDAARLRQRVRGARVEASRVELGLAGALNRARASARGEFLVSLHDDAEIEPGWLEALVAAVDADPQAGAVGSLILRMDRRVQAAGRELLPSGATRPAWGRSVRDLDRVHVVDQCGSASLLVRATTWDELGGADERFYPLYYVDVDLCVAILARGQRVLLAPRSVIRHHQGASTYRAFARFVHGRNRELFRAKWGGVVATHVPASGAVTPPAPAELPRQQWEPDPDRQERVQLERALAVTREYARSLQEQLAWREALRDRLRGVDARIDAFTRGRWKLLREGSLRGWS